MTLKIDEDMLRVRLFDGETVQTIANDLGFHTASLYRIIRRFGIILPQHTRSPRYNPVEYANDWLTKPLKAKAWAYLLGVYMGDGCVWTNPKKGRALFRLNTIDEDFREATRVALKTLSPYAVTCSPPHTVKRSDNLNYPLACGDPELCRRLVEATNGKNRLPDLPPETEREFVAGLMDSEGSVAESRTKSQTNRRFSMHFKVTFSEDCANPWIYQYHELLERIGLKVGKIGTEKPYHAGYRIPHRIVINIDSWINAGCYFKIQRKQKRVNEFASAGPYATVRSRPPRQCSMDGCEQRHLAKGYCGKHYQRRAQERV